MPESATAATGSAAGSSTIRSASAKSMPESATSTAGGSPRLRPPLLPQGRPRSDRSRTPSPRPPVHGRTGASGSSGASRFRAESSSPAAAARRAVRRAVAGEGGVAGEDGANGLQVVRQGVLVVLHGGPGQRRLIRDATAAAAAGRQVGVGGVVEQRGGGFRRGRLLLDQRRPTRRTTGCSRRRPGRSWSRTAGRACPDRRPSPARPARRRRSWPASGASSTISMTSSSASSDGPFAMRTGGQFVRVGAFADLTEVRHAGATRSVRCRARGARRWRFLSEPRDGWTPTGASVGPCAKAALFVYCP